MPAAARCRPVILPEAKRHDNAQCNDEEPGIRILSNLAGFSPENVCGQKLRSGTITCRIPLPCQTTDHGWLKQGRTLCPSHQWRGIAQVGHFIWKPVPLAVRPLLITLACPEIL